VVDGYYAAVHHTAGEADRPGGRTQDGVPGCGREVHAPVSGQPALGGFVETANNAGHRGQRPLPAWCGRCRSRKTRHRGAPCASQGEEEDHKYGGRTPGPRGRLAVGRRTDRRRNIHGASSARTKAAAPPVRPCCGPRPGWLMVRCRCGGDEAQQRAELLRRWCTLDEAVCCALILPAQPGTFPPAATGAPENRPESQDGSRKYAPQADYACSNYPRFP